MNTYKGYNLFYVNGSSHSAGGGLEDASMFSPNVKSKAYYLNHTLVTWYEKKYNVTWDSKSKVNFGHRLSEIIKIPCINESANGGGPERVVRMTYQFIEKNWQNRDKIFLILEKPEHFFRLDLYNSKSKEYFIVNYQEKPDKPKYKLEYATPDYLRNDNYIHELQSIFQDYLNHHHDNDEHGKKVDRAFIGLYTFCKQNNISIKLMSPIGEIPNSTEIYRSTMDKKDIINLSFSKDYVDGHIQHWCANNKMRISDEIGFPDDHPGYFGHFEYAILLKKWLDINLEEV